MKIIVFFLFFCATSFGAEPPALTAAQRADIQAMRDTISRGGYAGGEAIAAARRTFAALSLVGMSQQEVVALLGEPSKFASPTPGSVIYRFDTGYDGVEFVLSLDEHKRVTKVAPVELE